VGERVYNVYRSNKKKLYIYMTQENYYFKSVRRVVSGPLGLSMFFGGVQHLGYRPHTYLGLKTWKDL
jgi:hypothetical protein